MSRAAGIAGGPRPLLGPATWPRVDWEAVAAIASALGAAFTAATAALELAKIVRESRDAEMDDGADHRGDE